MSDETQQLPEAPQAPAETFLTMIVPASVVDLARNIAANLDPGGANMWITGLSQTGAAPATHFISTGIVPGAWHQLIPVETWELQEDQWVLVSETSGNPQAIYGLCLQKGLQVTLPEIEQLFVEVDITQQDPWTAISRLNIRMVQEDATQEGSV